MNDFAIENESDSDSRACPFQYSSTTSRPSRSTRKASVSLAASHARRSPPPGAAASPAGSRRSPGACGSGRGDGLARSGRLGNMRQSVTSDGP